MQSPGNHVVSETFDGEVTVIDLDAGTYFALGGAGATIWSWVAAGLDEARLREFASAAFSDPDMGRIDEFVEALIGHELLQRTDVGPRQAGSSCDTPVEPGKGQAPFIAPWIERYDDMAELLMLDPVHDVGRAPWPKVPPKSE